MIAFALTHYETYLLVLLRVVAFVATSPLLSVRSWPAWGKLGLAVFVALLVSPGIHHFVPSAFSDPGNYIVYALKESMTGIVLGFLATTIFSAITMAGAMVDMQIGFSSVTLFDPQAGQSSGLTGTFQSILFTFYFLGMNGLDGLMLAIMNSYRYIPLGTFHLPTGFWETMTHLLGVVMALSIQLAAPLLVALLFTDVTFALLSRAVPQMNVFVVGLPAKLFVGLTLFAVVMPAMVYLFGTLFNDLFTQMNNLLQFLGG